MPRLSSLGFYAQHVAYIGLSGRPDTEVLAFAFQSTSIVITKNVDDFFRLAGRAALHPGMRDGSLFRSEEWAWIEPVVLHLRASKLDPINKVIDVTAAGSTNRESACSRRRSAGSELSMSGIKQVWLIDPPRMTWLTGPM